jgi:hypothetical protein
MSGLASWDQEVSLEGFVLADDDSSGVSVLLAIRADWRFSTNLMQAMLVPSLPDAQQHLHSTTFMRIFSECLLSLRIQMAGWL